jgi:hypothetical protein
VLIVFTRKVSTSRRGPRCGNRGEVHDRICSAQDVECQPEVGQVRLGLLALQVGRTDEVDAQHVVAVRPELAHDHAPRLAAAAGDDDPSRQTAALAPTSILRAPADG